MTTRQKVIVLVAVFVTLLAAFLIMGALSSMKKKMTPPKATPVVRKVESAIVEYANIETSIVGTGRVLSQNSVDLISEVQGKLLPGDISLRKGASFKKGQLLAKVYDTDAIYAMKSRKSSFLNALANILPDLKIDYADSYQKWVNFFELVNIDKDLPPLPEISTNQEKIFLASRGVLRDYYSIKSDEERLKLYYLRAPFSGAVQEVMLEVGSVANPGSRIARIIKTSELEIEVPLLVEDAQWVRKGQKATLKTEAGREVGHGYVIREATFVDPNSQSINVYVKVETSSEALYAGEYLRVEFPGMVIRDAMEIPRNATFNSDMVYVVDSGYLAKKRIDILKTNETSVIFTGLNEGEELVVKPLANANANMPVQTQYSNVHKVIADTNKAAEIQEKMVTKDNEKNKKRKKKD
ncbi:MAG TPA: efflux transporter periplasmic adaptor subunit [Bacteroidales bacterium]|jgi:membrane fusion protein (multidrug efflux system)|nr:efflux transporter periplasmic adaptor subunit [Bacteroidales bacterium]